MLLRRAAAMRAQHAHCMRVIHHHQCVVALRQFTDCRQVGNRAVHRKHAVGCNHAVARALRCAQLLLQVRHVIVAVAQALRLAQAHPVNDRRVIKLVRDNRILSAKQRLKQPAICIPARGVQNGVFCAQKCAQLALQILVQCLRAAYEAHACQPITPLLKRRVRRLHNLRMGCQPKIIVGAQIEYIRAARNTDVRALRRTDDALFFVKAGAAHFCQHAAQLLPQTVCNHRY